MFVLACGVALVIPIARADAETIEGLEGKIADARNEAEALNDQIESDVVALAEARNEADRAAGEESELSQVLAEGQERSAALARKLDAAEAELAATQERLERAQAVLAQRLVEIYKSSGMNEVDVLLDSEGFEDLATRAELLGRIQDADRALAERVRSSRRTCRTRSSEWAAPRSARTSSTPRSRRLVTRSPRPAPTPRLAPRSFRTPAPRRQRRSRSSRAR